MEAVSREGAFRFRAEGTGGAVSQGRILPQKRETPDAETQCGSINLERKGFMDAIVYTTNAGSTRRYAQLLAKEAGLPVYSLEEAKKRVPAGAEVTYLGWIMAGAVKGYGCAARRYRVRAVCGVGMGRTGSQEDAVREKTGVPAEVPVFTLQGDFDVKKLRGIYRLMMEIMVKTAGKELAGKQDRTPEEDEMLDAMLHGGQRVRAGNLRAVLDWYGAGR